MFSDLVKSWRLLAGAAVFPFLLGFVAFHVLRSSAPRFVIAEQDGVPGNNDSIGEMRQTLAQERIQLAALEREQSSWRADVINRRKLYQEGQLSKEKVQEAEQAFVAALTRMHAARDAVTEIDVAITEAVLGEKVNRMPVLPVNGYSETGDLARFNGSYRWSLREAARIESYFSRTFNRRLPVTAMGQSETHKRLRFDHRDAMDVALHPDSAEGKALIQHLRKSGIPFIAFRGASPGVSTGPHIHVGRPSARLRH
jgi:hypothetical protein